MSFGRFPRGCPAAAGRAVATGRPRLHRGVPRATASASCDVDPPSHAGRGRAGQPWRLRSGETADVTDRAGFLAFARPGFVLIATSFELEASATARG